MLLMKEKSYMAKKNKEIFMRGETVVVQEDQIRRFQEEIEALVLIGELTYIEAIVDFCNRNDVEIESVKNLISPSLMGKIHAEAKEQRLIKDTTVELPL